MATAVEQIKDRLSILDVVGSYVTLQKAGKNYKAKSPFTNEKTPSFFVSPERGTYYCFSSSRGGDIFTFIEEMEGVDFKGALKILAERAGVELRPESPKKRSERETLYALIDAATTFFETNLKKHREVAQYLQKRGLTDESIKHWRIGYAPHEWRALKEHLEGLGFTEDMILRAGLIKRTDGGKSPYDVFRHRAMFPIADSSGRIVAFSGRYMGEDPASPKYVNSPETELFLKSRILFGYDKAKQGIRRMDFALIVEGQFDLVLAHQAGYRNTVAISGTALSDEQVTLLSRLSHRAVLALDADSAGIGSAKRSAALMLTRGMDVKVARMPEGKDPADLVADDPKLLRQTIGSATHVVEFLISILRDDVQDQRAFRLRARDEVVPFIAAIPDRIDQEHFEKLLAEAIGTSADAVHHEVVRAGEEEPEALREAPSAPAPTAKEKPRRREDLIAHLFGILLWQEKEENPNVNVSTLRADLKKVLGADGMELLEDWPDDLKSEAVFRAEKRYTDDNGNGSVTEVVSDYLRELHQQNLTEELREMREALREAERAGEKKKIDSLTKKCTHVQKQMTDLLAENMFIYN